MRDPGRWHDKVELTLDNRQVYFLFFGTAVAACLVFTVGVLVGKRLESGAPKITNARDHLAALDQLGTPEDDALTFHRTLADPRGKPCPRRGAFGGGSPRGGDAGTRAGRGSRRRGARRWQGAHGSAPDPRASRRGP